MRHLGLGLRAARSQWVRRVPDEPVAALAVLSPMLGRLPTPNGTVLGELAGRTAGLVPALFSSAAKRMLRPRGPVARAAEDGATGLGGLIGVAATTCPPTPESPPGQERVPDAVAEDPDLAGRFADFPLDLLDRAFQAIAQSDEEHGGHLSEPPDGRSGEGIVGTIRGSATEIVDLIGGSRPYVDCRPVGIDDAAGTIVDGVNPHLNPVVVDRVLGPFTGLREPRLAPPDLAPELDIPFWSFLRDHAPDWLLPGAADVPTDRVLALATNPAFVDAFLVGANQQSLGELRRRNIPVIAGWTPLRRFWQRISDDRSKPTDLDVVIRARPVASPRTGRRGRPLGHSSHQRSDHRRRCSCCCCTPSCSGSTRTRRSTSPGSSRRRTAGATAARRDRPHQAGATPCSPATLTPSWCSSASRAPPIGDLRPLAGARGAATGLPVPQARPRS